MIAHKGCSQFLVAGEVSGWMEWWEEMFPMWLPGKEKP